MNKKKNKKSISRSVLSVMSILMIGASLLSGCAKKTVDASETTPAQQNTSSAQKTSAIQEKGDVKEDAKKKVMDEFKQLLENNSKPDTVIAFIDKNLPNITKESASVMVTSLEELQLKYLPQFEERYYGENIQKNMNKVYKPGFDLSKLEEIQDKELKELLSETRDMGYKVETAEGMYFPIMNYEYYKKYSSNVTEDIKDYIDIMAVETNKVPAKDAALVIGYDEVINRALKQEAFIKTYGSSAKAEDMKKLQKKYITFMLYGLNNTPLFSYETKVINPEAKAVYLNAVKNNKDSSLITMLGKYMDILAKTDYKFSEEADKFRKEVVQ